MWSIRTEVANAASRLGVVIDELTHCQAEAVRMNILHNFTDDQKRWPQWIWEHTHHAIYVTSPDGWRWIGAFAPTCEVIMHFAIQDESAMYRLPNGKVAEAVLSECFGFEVYFTNGSADYLLGQNHHDTVFACGTAKEWLDNHRAELVKNLPAD